MPLDLRVAFVFTEIGIEMLCVLCDETFVTTDMAWVLKDGNVPVGYLCPECLVNPRRAAERARSHAARIRSLAVSSRAFCGETLPKLVHAPPSREYSQLPLAVPARPATAMPMPPPKAPKTSATRSPVGSAVPEFVVSKHR